MSHLFTTIVEQLREQHKTVATMESCTGGGLANAITNIPGASEVIGFSAVTYSNDFKIKMGVSADVIDKHTVYSTETAKEMSRNIAQFAGADFGIGITGQLRRTDPNNPVGADDCVYYSIWSRATNSYAVGQMTVEHDTRAENKAHVLNAIGKRFALVLKNEKERQPMWIKSKRASNEAER